MALTVSNAVLTGLTTATIVGGTGCLADGTDTTYIDVDAALSAFPAFTIDISGTFTPGVLSLDVAAEVVGLPGFSFAYIDISYALAGSGSTYVTDGGVTATVETAAAYPTSRAVIRHDRPAGASSALLINAVDCATINSAGGLTASVTVVGLSATLRIYEAGSLAVGSSSVPATAVPLMGRARIW